MYRTVPLNRSSRFEVGVPAARHAAASGGAIRMAALLSADGLAVLMIGSFVSHWFLDVPPDSSNVSTLQEWAVEIRILPVILAVILFAIFSGCHRRGTSFLQGIRLVMQASLYAMGIEVMLGIAFNDITSREPVFAALALLPIAVAALNAATRQLLDRTGLWRMPVVLAGDARGRLVDDSGQDYRITGRVDLRSLKPDRQIPSIRALLAAYGAEGLLIASSGQGTRVQDLANRAALEGVPVDIALPLACAGHNGFRCRVGPSGLVLAFDPSMPAATARLAKSAIDIAGAAILLAILSPIILLIAAIIRRDGGPALFVHRRIGLDGRPFGCLKFRTMVIDAEQRLQNLLANNPAAAQEWQSTRKLRNDPRVTRLGAFLRRTSLDELPQLINVLRRDMSLVGPRPIEESEAGHYGDHIGYYCAVRPGITGLWQVSGRSNTTYERRVNLDVRYVTGWSLAADIRILLRTIPEVLRREGAY